jgi:DNA polymerase-4
MDAFFASIEQRDNPSLLTMPMAVIGSNARTVLVSPSYEARDYGVKTGMTKYQAKLLCPDIVFVTGNTGKYASACSTIAKILYAFTPDIEISSIDEFFLDITNTMHLFGTAEDVAGDAKARIKKQLGLSSSIGIAHNKLLAKFASEKAKPGGIYNLKREDVAAVFENTKVGELCGIGKKTSEQLNLMGIGTLGRLRRCSPVQLKHFFGVKGPALLLMADGIDDSLVVPVGTEDEAKSMGHSMTFKEDTADADILSRYLLELAVMVGRRLRKSALSAGTIKLTLRYKSFQTITRQKALSSPTDDTKAIYHTARFILRGITLKEPVRLLGITGSGLSANTVSGSLFLQDMKRYRINKVLDSINERFNHPALFFASLLDKDKHNKVISPAWRPAGNRNY